MKNIAVALFDVESEGYQAIANLRQMPITDSYAILQMALVKREGGTVKLCEGFDSGANTVDNTITGGLIGGLLGIIGGPIGVILMGAYGAMAGRMVDVGDALDGASMIEMVVDKLDDGTVALVILAEEKDEAALDACLKDNFKVMVLRYDAAAIEDEVKEAAMVEEEVARQTRMKLRKEVKAEAKQRAKDRHEMIEEELGEVRKILKDSEVDLNID